MWVYKTAAVLVLVGLPAFAGAVSVDGTRFAPEPETLGLIAGAAVAWAIVRWRKRK